MGLEEDNGVHSKESYKQSDKATHEKYGEHIKIDETNAVANPNVIDVNKRGKVKDITGSGEFGMDEPKMTE